MQSSEKPQQKSYRKGSPLYFSAGLIVSLVLIITAFEWKTPHAFVDEAIELAELSEDPTVFVPVVIPEPPRPKPIKAPPIKPILPSPNITTVTDPPIDKPVDNIVDIPVVDIPVIDIKPTDEHTDVIHDIVEKEAVPIGGLEEFYDFLSKNIEYPRKAQRQDMEGKVFVSFVIDEKGNVIDAKVVEGRELGYGLDEEAIRVIKLTKWTPAEQRGRAVKMRKVIPVFFQLQR